MSGPRWAPVPAPLAKLLQAGLAAHLFRIDTTHFGEDVGGSHRNAAQALLHASTIGIRPVAPNLVEGGDDLVGCYIALASTRVHQPLLRGWPGRATSGFATKQGWDGYARGCGVPLQSRVDVVGNLSDPYGLARGES